MRQTLLSIAVCTAVSLVHAEKAGEEKKPKLVITPSFYEGVIHLRDLDTSGGTNSALFYINRSGRYYVADDLELAPAANNLAGIRIAVSNVVVNLNETTITQQSSNTATSLVGIDVDAALSNVQIFNGGINGFVSSSGTSIGIRVSGSAGGTFDVIRLRDLTINNCSRGLEFNGNSGETINNAWVEKVTVTNCGTAATEAGLVVELRYCNNALIQDCLFSNNTSNNQTRVIRLQQCVACRVERCSANDNSTTATTHPVKPFDIWLSKACSFVDCSALNNSGNTAYGFYQASAQFNVFERCRGSYNIANVGNNRKAYGFFSEATSGITGNMFIDCEAVGNTVEDGGTGTPEVAGIGLGPNEKNSAILRCRCRSNRNLDADAGDAYGILLYSSVTACEVRDNVVQDNVSTAGISYGIRDQATNSTTIYVNNFVVGQGVNYSIDPADTGGDTDFSNARLGAPFSDLSALATAKDSYYNIDVS